MSCQLCPRNCGVDRKKKETGYCGVPEELRVARAALHMWEEPCISGKNGSGAVFFAGCPLHCIFCQNHSIAAGQTGKNISIGRLAEIFLELQEKKANNLNLVTPTQYVPQIRQALDSAKKQGLRIPVVYNTSSYETPETLKQLEGYVDVYLPDYKYHSSELAGRCSHAADYPQVAMAAIEEMFRQTGEPCFFEKENRAGVEEGIMKRGIIIRHLVLPGQQQDSKELLKDLFQHFHNRVFYSIMNQYTPLPALNLPADLNRMVTEKEYDGIIDYALSLGIENGFLQEGETQKDSFIPEFDCEGV